MPCQTLTLVIHISGFFAVPLSHEEGRGLELACLKCKVQRALALRVAAADARSIAHKLAHTLEVVDGHGEVQRGVTCMQVWYRYGSRYYRYRR